jgi:hypothetical protein
MTATQGDMKYTAPRWAIFAVSGLVLAAISIKVPQSLMAGPSGYRTNRAVDQTEPSRLIPRAGFGRFQGL